MDDDPDPAQTDDLAQSVSEFGLELINQLADRSGDNQFVSPYSVVIGLAMVYAGARGETREQIADVLHDELGESIHPVVSSLRTTIESHRQPTRVSGSETSPVELTIANAVWGRADVEFADSYRDLLSEHYGTDLHRANFATNPDGERERINEWAVEATDGHVRELLPNSAIGPATVFVLTNAIHFGARWADEFDPDGTAPGTFTALDGERSTVPFMHQQLETLYATVDDAEAVELPYIGGELSMLLVLPEAGEFEAFERSLDAEKLSEILEARSQTEGEVALPRFEFGKEHELSEILSAMGMPAAFDADADLGGMFDGVGSGSVHIDDVYSGSYVAVDEEGTEATAATAVVGQEIGGAFDTDYFELQFDRPFLFCIRDRQTDVVLFLGRVVDAEAAQPE